MHKKKGNVKVLSPVLPRMCVVMRRDACNGGWDGILPKRNVWVGYSCRNQLCKGLVLYINTNRALNLPGSNCGLSSYACGARLQDEGQHRTAAEGVCNVVPLIPLKRLHESLFQKSRN